MLKSNPPTEMNEPESSFYFTNKHQQNPGCNISYKKSPLGKNEIGKLLKTIPFAEFVFQSDLIQMYLWLCMSDKWLPERKKSQDLYKLPSIQLQRRMSF